MSKHFLVCLLVAVATALSNGPSVMAGFGKTTITDESGEEVVVKHGLFSHKTMVKDRLGNVYERKRGLFGTKDTKVDVLGNEVHTHKGLFGFSNTDAHSILGDSVTSKKNPLYRDTNVNVKGVSGLLNKYFKSKQTNIPLAPSGTINQGQPESLPAINAPSLPNPSPAAGSGETRFTQ